MTSVLEQAIQKHQQGHLQEAGALYRHVLAQDPKNPEALRLMSMLAEQVGDLPMALELARQAVAVQPRRLDAQLQLGNVLLTAGQGAEAAQVARQIIQLDRRAFDGYFLLGDALQQQGDYAGAIEQYRKALQFNRGVPELYNNLGNARLALNRVDEAIAAYQQAIGLKIDYAEAYFNLGNAYRQAGHAALAIDAYRKAVRFQPRFFQAFSMLGLTLKLAGQPEEALVCYDQALALVPENHPVAAITWYNKGNVHQDAKRFREAADCYQRALAIRPEYFEATNNLAIALFEQGDIEAALELYRQLAARYPDNPAFRINEAITLPVIYDSAEAVPQWRARYTQKVEALLADPALPRANADLISTLATTGFYLAYQGQNDKELQVKVAQVFRRVLGEPPLTMETRPRHVKPKIGFVSRHLSYRHTIGKLMQGVILNLSRELFDVVVFSVGTENAYEKTGQEHPDDRFHTLPLRDLDQALAAIRAEQPDILYFTDIGMDPFTYLLAHHRLAPVQCTTWGHPVTTGIPTMDYFLSSTLVETEGSADQYTETLVPLSTFPFYYYRPTLETPVLTREELGVGPEQTLYVCPQSLFKFHPDTDAIFGNILRRDPNGVLILLSHYSAPCNERLMARLARQYPDVVDRIRFAPRLSRDKFMNLMAMADVLLDSIHFSGGNTSYEAFAFGTPIITLDNPYMKGRLTVGLYKKMSLTECIAPDTQAYIEMALRLGQDPEARAALRARILERCPVLFEEEAAVRELEAFFLDALSRVDRP